MPIALPTIPAVATRHSPTPARPLLNHPADAPPLRLVFWETTVGCNLACVHCRRLDVSFQLSKLDMSTQRSLEFIRTIPELGKPILVFSGGEPLMRPDIWELASEARRVGLPAALATNGTLVTEDVARRVKEVGFRRVSISFDGPDAPTHDQFRGAGAFDQSIAGFRFLRDTGMSMQINTTIAKHNFRKLDETYKLALDLGADALHLFMLVPVGCGAELSPDIMLDADEYESTLNWIYDRSLENKIHLKATCAPHYFRILRQRARADGRPMPTRSLPPEGTGRPRGDFGLGHPGGHPSGHPGGQAMPTSGRDPGGDMSAMTKGCLAGQAVCFVSHTGEVFPCGYLPVSSGNVTQTPLPEIWKRSPVFADMRDDRKLEGKCGVCEYSKVCMGCRARAFSQAGNYLAEEPNCGYTPIRMR
jgi:radical SAM protein with 4Fe4S-binding SPASM domain